MIAMAEILQLRRKNLEALGEQGQPQALLGINRNAFIAVRDFYLEVRADQPAKEHDKWRKLEKTMRESPIMRDPEKANLIYGLYFKWLEELNQEIAAATVGGAAGLVFHKAPRPERNIPETPPFPAHRHPNPDGSLGGWVADDARVSPLARVDATAMVGPQTSIGDGAKIGPRVRIGQHVEIRDGAEIGEGTAVGDYTRVCMEASVGKRNTIGPFAEIGVFVKTWNDVTIGFGANLGHGTSTWAGEKVKIGNFAFLREGARLEEGEVLFAGETKKPRPFVNISVTSS